jgi:chitinase
VLNVTGAGTASLPLGLAESFTFSPVPGGTYTLKVSAQNAAGTSAASNAVTLTFPGACSGAPLAPVNFLAHKVGGTIFVVWDPAASGPATTGYLLNVSGAFVGSFPTTSRTLSGTAGPGAYGLSVLATNACGSSPPTSVQTVSIP